MKSAIVVRLLIAAGLLLALAMGHERRALALAPTIEARLTCGSDPRVVVCAVHVAPSLASHVTWVEGTVLSAPPFARPLRLRATYTEKTPGPPELHFVLTPTRAGDGRLVMALRGVVCADNGTACPSFSKTLVASLHVPRRSTR